MARTEWTPVPPDLEGLELDQLRQDYNRLEDKLAELQAEKDQAYLERNHLVAVLAHLYPSGTRKTTIAGWDDAWQGCVYIDLPDAEQISYHYHTREEALFSDLPPYTKPYNGHTKVMVHASLQKLWTWNQLIPVQWIYDWAGYRRGQWTFDAIPEYAQGVRGVRFVLNQLEQDVIRYQVAKVRECNPEDI